MMRVSLDFLLDAALEQTAGAFVKRRSDDP
jgi:hypothetical protein